MVSVPPPGHRVAGVDREVHQHLLELAGVGQHRVQAAGEGGDQLDVLAEGSAQHALHGGDGGVEVEDLRPHHLPAGEGEELAGEAGRPLAGPADLAEVGAGRLAARGPVRFAGLLEFLGGERRVVEDHAEQVVEVVGDPAGELAEALQPLGLQQLLLRLVLPRERAACPWPAAVTGIPSLPGQPGHRGPPRRRRPRMLPGTGGPSTT